MRRIVFWIDVAVFAFVVVELANQGIPPELGNQLGILGVLALIVSNAILIRATGVTGWLSL